VANDWLNWLNKK